MLTSIYVLTRKKLLTDMWFGGTLINIILSAQKAKCVGSVVLINLNIICMLSLSELELLRTNKTLLPQIWFKEYTLKVPS